MKKLINKFLPGGVTMYSPTNSTSFNWQDNVSAEDKNKINTMLEDSKKAKNSPIVAPLSMNNQNELLSEVMRKQTSLQKLGYYNKGIDGKWGNGSIAGEKAALKAGYTWNGKEYYKPKAQLSSILTDVKAPHARTVSEEALDKSTSNWSKANEDTQWISHPIGSMKLIAKPTVDVAKSSLNLLAARSPIGTAASIGINTMYDNMYPYSYGDKLVNKTTGETIAYDGGNIPEGWSLKQISATEDPMLLGEAGFNKIKNSGTIDPRRHIMNLLADIDLNSNEGKSQWKDLETLAKNYNMVFFNGNPLTASLTPELKLFYLRARLDNMSMYNNGTMKYNTYEVNPEFESPTAVARKAKTYRIADPKMRELVNLEMANYWLATAKNAKWLKPGDEGYADSPYRITSDGKYVMQNMGYLGNQSLVADDINGLNLRNGDWWDYVIDNPNARPFYTGDRLVAQGTRPTRSGGIGLNKQHMTESTNQLFDAILEAAKIKQPSQTNKLISRNS